MRKHFLAVICFASAATSVSAQTLFTIGKDTVTVQEFTQAYKKNNLPGKATTPVREYMNLYIASRLKIKEAKERGYDTLPQLTADLQALRAQILPGYLTDKAALEKLVNEAFHRSQKDIRLAHLFIGTDGADTLSAYKKAMEAYQQLKAGKSFAAVAKQYSDDASAQQNGGSIGYITLFTLPYELENLAYSTPAGRFSAPYRSKGGYHIFKNEGERKAAGRLQLAQILISYPPEADAAIQQGAKKLADSLYNRILKGDDFGNLATRFSNDAISSAAHGKMQEFGVGQYDATFEQQAFALVSNGAVSKPFQTPHGWHIIKRLGRVPVATDRNSAAVIDDLKAKVEASDRMNRIHEAMAKKILATYEKDVVSQQDIWSYSDSVLEQKATPVKVQITPQSPLFYIGMQAITAADWIMYVQMNRYNSNGGGAKPYSQLWEAFRMSAAMDYYKANLEQFNPAFKAQLEEFRDGNLFFEIMQKEVWGPAQTDTAALEVYYAKHKEKYQWKESAEAVVFYINDIATAKIFEKALLQSPGQWKTILTHYDQLIIADSNRYEMTNLPGITKAHWRAGAVSPLVINKEENTATLSYIVKTYNRPEQRSFSDAKGLVINDYQAQLEKEWVETLRKKYPVTIQQAALQKLK